MPRCGTQKISSPAPLSSKLFITFFIPISPHLDSNLLMSLRTRYITCPFTERPSYSAIYASFCLISESKRMLTCTTSFFSHQHLRESTAHLNYNSHHSTGVESIFILSRLFLNRMCANLHSIKQGGHFNSAPRFVHIIEKNILSSYFAAASEPKCDPNCLRSQTYRTAEHISDQIYVSIFLIF